MLEKLTRSLTEGIEPLLAVGVRFNDDDAIDAFETVWTELIVKIKGDAWKLTGKSSKSYGKEISKATHEASVLNSRSPHGS
jgi:hypothetical protein